MTTPIPIEAWTERETREAFRLHAARAGCTHWGELPSFPCGVACVDELLTGRPLVPEGVDVWHDGRQLAREAYALPVPGAPGGTLADPSVLLGVLGDRGLVQIHAAHLQVLELAEMARQLETLAGAIDSSVDVWLGESGQPLAAAPAEAGQWVYQLAGHSAWQCAPATMGGAGGSAGKKVRVTRRSALYVGPGGSSEAHLGPDSALLVVKLHFMTQGQYADLLVQRASWRQPLLRHALVRSEAQIERLAEAAQDCITSEANRRLTVQAIHDRHLTSRRPLLPGQWLSMLALGSLHDGSRLRVRPTILFTLKNDGQWLQLCLHRKRITLPTWVEPALELMTRSTSFSPSTLAGLMDHDSRLTLCKRLIREGFLHWDDVMQ